MIKSISNVRNSNPNSSLFLAHFSFKGKLVWMVLLSMWWMLWEFTSPFKENPASYHQWWMRTGIEHLVGICQWTTNWKPIAGLKVMWQKLMSNMNMVRVKIKILSRDAVKCSWWQSSVIPLAMMVGSSSMAFSTSWMFCWDLPVHGRPLAPLFKFKLVPFCLYLLKGHIMIFDPI